MNDAASATYRRSLLLAPHGIPAYLSPSYDLHVDIREQACQPADYHQVRHPLAYTQCYIHVCVHLNCSRLLRPYMLTRMHSAIIYLYADHTCHTSGIYYTKH